jgi:ABC-type nitrate/sulfonate/bicarbonate transport system substrate-binding protein
MMQDLGIGTVVRRTGDLWPGAPGCSLTTTRRVLREKPDLVRRVLAAFVQGAEWTSQQPAEAAIIGAGYIGVSGQFIHAALAQNRPNIEALFNEGAMEQILELMLQLGYLKSRPADFMELSYLREINEGVAAR